MSSVEDRWLPSPLTPAHERWLLSFRDVGPRRVEALGAPFGPGEIAPSPPPVALVLPLTVPRSVVGVALEAVVGGEDPRILIPVAPDPGLGVVVEDDDVVVEVEVRALILTERSASASV